MRIKTIAMTLALTAGLASVTRTTARAQDPQQGLLPPQQTTRSEKDESKRQLDMLIAQQQQKVDQGGAATDSEQLAYLQNLRQEMDKPIPPTPEVTADVDLSRRLTEIEAGIKHLGEYLAGIVNDLPQVRAVKDLLAKFEARKAELVRAFKNWMSGEGGAQQGQQGWREGKPYRDVAREALAGIKSKLKDPNQLFTLNKLYNDLGPDAIERDADTLPGNELASQLRKVEGQLALLDAVMPLAASEQERVALRKLQFALEQRQADLQAAFDKWRGTVRPTVQQQVVQQEQKKDPQTQNIGQLASTALDGAIKSLVQQMLAADNFATRTKLMTEIAALSFGKSTVDFATGVITNVIGTATGWWGAVFPAEAKVEHLGKAPTGTGFTRKLEQK